MNKVITNIGMPRTAVMAALNRQTPLGVVGDSVKRTVETPVITQAEAGDAVTITGDLVAKHYYTINGDTPNAESTEYTAPIELEADATVKVISIRAGYTDSAVASKDCTAYVAPEE